MDKYSQLGGETACSDWSLLLLPGTLNFCAASVDICKSGGSSIKALGQHKLNIGTISREITFLIAYCEHSAVLPLLWKSIIHWISWLFSSSNCKRKSRFISHVHNNLNWATFNNLAWSFRRDLNIMGRICLWGGRFCEISVCVSS